MQAPKGIPGPSPPPYPPPLMTQLSPIARPFFPQFRPIAAAAPKSLQNDPPSTASQLPPTKMHSFGVTPSSATAQLPLRPSQPAADPQSPVSKFKQQLVSTRPTATAAQSPLQWRAASEGKEQRGQPATTAQAATSTANLPPSPLFWRAAEPQEQRGQYPAVRSLQGDGRSTVAAKQSSGAGGLQVAAKDAGKAVPGGSKNPSFVGYKFNVSPPKRRVRW
jgi:hypothetical protein